jgi:Mlc titration factor MtfA (ptsG expression regulator)
MEIFFILVLLLLVLIVVFLFFATFFTVFEQLYAKIFKKPLYIHFYPFPKLLTVNQLEILSRDFQFYQQLSENNKKYFEHRVAKFISKKKFIGKDNFVITDEVKVLIAATSCMLTFGMRHYLYKGLEAIIVYPSVYLSTVSNEYHKGEFNPRMKVIAFSWEDFLEGFQNNNDNLNLGIHEFGHALHFYGLKSEDISALIFANMFEKISQQVNHKPNQQRLIESDYFRVYGYTNQFEFLAVILEHYFETPLEFKNEFPELFQNVSLMLNHKHQNL